MAYGNAMRISNHYWFITNWHIAVHLVWLKHWKHIALAAISNVYTKTDTHLNGWHEIILLIYLWKPPMAQHNNGILIQLFYLFCEIASIGHCRNGRVSSDKMSKNSRIHIAHYQLVNGVSFDQIIIKYLKWSMQFISRSVHHYRNDAFKQLHQTAGDERVTDTKGPSYRWNEIYHNKQ